MDHNPAVYCQMPNPRIRLKSSDGEIFEVEVKVAQCFLPIKEMLDDLGFEDNEVIPIPGNAPEISGAILGKLIQWANHHKDDLAAAEDNETKVTAISDMSSWDIRFLQVDQTSLLQLIRAANYLNVKGVLDVACMKVAKMMKGMTLEEVRHTFCIQNDFSPDEEEQVRRENAWCDGMHFGARGRPVNDSVIKEIPAYSVKDVDNDGGRVNENCLNNSLVVSEILQHLSDVELVVFSQLNKMWNYEARNLMRKRSTIIASLDCNDSCQVVQAFTSDLKQMNIVPFCGMRIVLPGTSSDSCRCEVLALDPTDDLIFDPLPFKTLTVELGEKRWDSQDCREFQLLKRIVQDLSAVLEELSILTLSNPENFSQYYDQECSFPRLKILKLKDAEELQRSSSLTNPDYVDYFKTLISRAPNMREVHSDGPPRVLLSLVEGTAVVPVCSYEVCTPFVGISRDMLSSVLRLQRMKLVSTAGGRSLDLFGRTFFSVNAPVMVRAPCTSTLCDLTVDTILAEALVSYRVCLENVRKLTMVIHYGEFEEPERQHTMRIVKDFDFTRIFPNLSKVYIESPPEHLPYRSNRLLYGGNADLKEPMPDRAVNIKELHLHHRVLHNNTAPYFSHMFPNIERLYVETLDEADDFNFGSICEHWVDLKELHIKSKVLEDTANFDCTFCGIFFDEVVQLIHKDDEYLKRVNIVPVKPCITCLRNLRVLSLEYDLNRRPEPIIYDATIPMFFLSKITGMTAFARCPNLAVTLKISPGGAHAVSHLKPYVSVELYG